MVREVSGGGGDRQRERIRREGKKILFFQTKRGGVSFIQTERGCSRK